MARQFDGTNDSLVSASALTMGVSRIAVGFWLYSTFAADDDIILELSTNSNTTAGTFKVIGSESGFNVFWVDIFGSGGKSARSCPNPSNNAWHHVLINLNIGNAGSSEVESIWIDGVSQTLTSRLSQDNTGNFSDQTLYVMSRANTSLFADGRMADLCVWKPATALGSTEATALAGGDRAGTVRASEIAYYWPLEGTTSPEPASVGSIALTVNGATQVADPPTLDPLGGSVPSGSATGAWTFAGSATGTRTPKATAGGAFTYSGAASGKRTPKGSATGTFTYSGSATGDTPANDGTASGGFTFTGTATGARSPKGSASGTLAYTGAATGQRAPKGGVTGSWTFTGTAAGKRPAGGSATGTWTYTSTAVGQRSAKGTASGTWAYSGSAVGDAPLPGMSEGSAVGSWSFTGTAAGARAPKGAAAGSWAYTGAAVGHRTPKGAAAGAYAYAGAAAEGATVRQGAATGAWAYVGAAVGTAGTPVRYVITRATADPPRHTATADGPRHTATADPPARKATP